MARGVKHVVVFDGPRWQADVVAAALQARGFDAEAVQTMRLGTVVEAQVTVPGSQAAQARRIIETAEK